MRNATSIAFSVLLLGATMPAALAADVIVNAVRVDDATVRALENLYRVPIRPGRYWYDALSGAWGFEGGPTAGLVLPRMPLGGALRADASRGDTGIFVNGRQLHRLDVQALSRCLPPQRGRYWVLHTGLGGYEGGPPLFDLAQLCAARGGGAPAAMQCETYGNGQFNCGKPGTRTDVSSVIGEGGKDMGVYVPGGGLVLTPN